VTARATISFHYDFTASYKRFALTRTGRWEDPRPADRHGDVSEESRRADRLPVEAPGRGGGGDERRNNLLPFQVEAGAFKTLPNTPLEKNFIK
jgi:hypothetical protein